MLLAALSLILPTALRAIDPKPSLPAPDKQGLYAGYRAISLPMAGYKIAFLEKGQRVDLLVTFDAVMKDKKKEKVTATIMQDVVVVNVQKPAKLEENGVVELLLNPNEAQYAALSQYQGELSISRRAEGDVAMAPMEMASLRKLFR
jgi:Flp pilus assembly protein CpaB